MNATLLFCKRCSAFLILNLENGYAQDTAESQDYYIFYFSIRFLEETQIYCMIELVNQLRFIWLDETNLPYFLLFKEIDENRGGWLEKPWEFDIEKLKSLFCTSFHLIKRISGKQLIFLNGSSIDCNNYRNSVTDFGKNI